MKHWLSSRTKGMRVALLLLLDVITISGSSLLALLVRFDFNYNSIPLEYLQILVDTIFLHMSVTLIIFFIFRMYHSLWSMASISELFNIVLANLVSIAVCGFIFWWRNFRMPLSFLPMKFVIQTGLVITSRFSYRFMRQFHNYRTTHQQKVHNTMVIGAGEAGRILIRELIESRYLSDKVYCVIDDDDNKRGLYINGVPVVGGRNCILDAVSKYSIDTIILAIPSAPAEEIKNILNICKMTSCQLKILPGVYQVIKGEVNMSKVRDVEIQDLLGRPPINVNTDDIMGYVSDKVVMVTGGGGSIGSELCRQIAKNNPKKLIVIDIYENSVYDIQQELKNEYKELDLVVLIASVRNAHRIDQIFETYHPQIIYHAAAHKHVPLMEDSPNEAIKNNVFGTYKTAEAADKYGAERFVLISTDKAVNPTNIMGASKRLCEMVIQTFAKRSHTIFVAVRFGNVLGSNGSVIPLFRKQIEVGGPVTVTHPDIIRYFMLIPEAVSLVLQAGAYAQNGQIFVLDMGEPVKIVDLARNLIRCSGFIPDKDIKIQYMGLRPGEKLYEELLMQEEGLQRTKNNLIYIGKPLEFDEEKFMKDLAKLKEACYKDADNIKELVTQMVPTYKITDNKNV